MAKLVDVGSIGCYFESLSDPRHTRNRKHLLVDIAVISVCGILCGCDGPTAIHRWAALQMDWLSQYLTLPNGIPSRDCIRRLLLALKPEAFQRCFQTWITDAIVMDDSNMQRLVAIDGKTNRRSHDHAKDLGALHIVSAWASEEGIALGQVATDAKSNEITAIPQLLAQINLTDTIITIDAMGCQKDIVEQIVDGGGDAVIAVKDNQPNLKAAIETHFIEHLNRDLEDLRYRFHETRDKGHGRKDERSYYLTKPPSDFGPKEDWPWVKAIGYTLRLTQHADGTETNDVRYYICTRYLSGKRFAEAVRGHWSIESMHWVLVDIAQENQAISAGDNLEFFGIVAKRSGFTGLFERIEHDLRELILAGRIQRTVHGGPFVVNSIGQMSPLPGVVDGLPIIHRPRC